MGSGGSCGEWTHSRGLAEGAGASGLPDHPFKTHQGIKPNGSGSRWSIWGLQCGRSSREGVGGSCLRESP